MLSLSYQFGVQNVTRVGKNDLSEFFVIKAPDGTEYYTNSYEAVNKNLIDNLQNYPLPPEPFAKLQKVFNYYEKDKLMDAVPNLEYKQIFSLVSENLQATKKLIEGMVRQELLKSLRLNRH
jgi:hypothetical protein